MSIWNEYQISSFFQVYHWNLSRLQIKHHIWWSLVDYTKLFGWKTMLKVWLSFFNFYVINSEEKSLLEFSCFFICHLKKCTFCWINNFCSLFPKRPLSIIGISREKYFCVQSERPWKRNDETLKAFLQLRNSCEIILHVN